MPPKFKFTREQIVEAGLNLVRQGGWEALSTRSLADELGSSSRPIYSFFQSMAELEEEIVIRAVTLLQAHMEVERTGDPWHDHGIGYALFAMEEKHLFRSVNDEKHIDYYAKYGKMIWDTLTSSLAGYPPFQGLTEDQVYQVQLTRWLFAHGLAFQLSNPPSGLWNDQNIVSVMREGSDAILDGLKKQFQSRK